MFLRNDTTHHWRNQNIFRGVVGIGSGQTPRRPRGGDCPSCPPPPATHTSRLLPGGTALGDTLIRCEDDLVDHLRVHTPILEPADLQQAAFCLQIHRGGRRNGRPPHHHAGTVGPGRPPLPHRSLDHLAFEQAGQRVAHADVPGGVQAGECLAACHAVTQLYGVLERAVQSSAGGLPGQHVAGGGQLPWLRFLIRKIIKNNPSMEPFPFLRYYR